jgi:membrane protease YdiL (CAAX protease family)
MDHFGIIGINNNAQKKRASSILLFLLLFARIILINLIRFRSQDIPYWVNVTYELMAYLLIYLFIRVNQNDLASFHLDKLSIIFTILFSSILRIEINNYPYLWIAAIGFWIISLYLLVILVRKWSILPMVKLNWIIISIPIGFALPLIFNFFINLKIDIISEFGTLGRFLYYSLFVAINQLGHAPIQEEILFRGLLWGHLLHLGWDNKKIWLIQAFLFLLAHLFYIRLGISYWLYTGIIGIVLGLFAWRTQSILPSAIAHTIDNGISFTLQYLAK